MSASDYNLKQIDLGRLTGAQITTLVESWQRMHPQLVVDGYAGPRTLASLGISIDKVFPLRALSDGRRPVITSGFYTENPDRPSHKGVDFFYPWLDPDPDMPTGDGGAIIKHGGKRKWWVPPGTEAIAAAAGFVSRASDSPTGWKLWIDHEDGNRSGYFHGTKLLVEEGQCVGIGEPVMVVGDNPRAHDAKHLHFEISTVDGYLPTNPRLWLQNAQYRAYRA